MAENPVDRKILTEIQDEVLGLIAGVVEKRLKGASAADAEARPQVRAGGVQGRQVHHRADPVRQPGRHRLPTTPDKDGDIDPLGETERVQRFGPLQYHWTGDPFVTGDAYKAHEQGK